MTMQVIPIHLKNDVQPADDLVDLLLSSSKSTFENGDVLVVSQKIISKHEGQVVKLESIIPSELSIGIASNNWITGDSSFNTTVNDISASNFNSTSDIRLKTNIQPIGDPIGKVKQIEGVSFNWKKDNKPALGVIADQVEKILPELVHGDDPKTVNYNGLIGLLIETVKEQQNQIDELKDRISKLE